MSDKALDLMIENAASSIEMEGYVIDSQSKEWCKQLINKEISITDYINLVKAKAGVA